MIKKWPQFENEVRLSGSKLLDRLDDFPNAVLVAGCQRSGTTMLAKIIAESDGIHNFRLGAADPCLDAGLILSSAVEHDPRDLRYCFQTTHVDECYGEYFEHAGDFRMIWCLRNPLSVVYSLMYNWSKWGLNTTYARCGAERTSEEQRGSWLTRALGGGSNARLHKACMIYNAKVAQIFELADRLQCRGIVVVEYDELVKRKTEVLPRLYEFLDLDYKATYADKILVTSLNKASRLRPAESENISRLCGPIYEQAKAQFWDAELEPLSRSSVRSL